MVAVRRCVVTSQPVREAALSELRYVTAELRTRGMPELATTHEQATNALLADRDRLAGEYEKLRGGIEDYLLWEPGRSGHAEAHRRLAAALTDRKEGNDE